LCNTSLLLLLLPPIIMETPVVWRLPWRRIIYGQPKMALFLYSLRYFAQSYFLPFPVILVCFTYLWGKVLFTPT
jgi:hypothetical protein